MNNNNQNIELDEILTLLKSEENRDEAIALLKSIEPKNDEVKGLKLFLESNNWDFNKVDSFIGNSSMRYKKIEVNDAPKSSKAWLKIAAIIVPLLAMGSYFIVTNLYHKESLYAQYYEKEVGLPVLMGTNEKKVFNESMNAFKDNDFQEALDGFEQLRTVNSNNDTLLYYSACSNMELGNNKEAINQFENIQVSSAFFEKTEYRLALIYIRLEEYDSAKTVLLSIKSNQKHQYYSRSVELLDEDVFK